MSSLAEDLWDNLNLGLSMIRVGGTFQAFGGHTWAMSTQVNNGQLTSRIGLVCDNEAALAEFTQLAEAAGHTVERTSQRNAVLITPKPE